MNPKISVFLICVEAIIYLLIHNLHDFTFKKKDPKRPFRHILRSKYFSTERAQTWFITNGSLTQFITKKLKIDLSVSSKSSSGVQLGNFR